MRGLLALAVLAVLAVLAGCGAHGGSRAPTGTPEPEPARPAAPGVGREKAATVVFFQRQGAGGATLDTITVRADGTATRQKRYGGAGGRFTELRLRPGRLARLRAALRRLPPHGATLTRGNPPPGGAQYLLRYAGRTLTGRAGAIARSARPAVRSLDGFIDGIGVRTVKTDAATHRP